MYHSPIDDEKTAGQAGLPRLLVRDLGLADAAKQPPMILESRPPSNDMKDYPYLCYGGDNNQGGKTSYLCSNRLIVERQKVVEPRYEILMFPFQTGEALPKTAWNKERTVLTIKLGNGVIDAITFDRSNPDHRTRLLFQRKEEGK